MSTTELTIYNLPFKCTRLSDADFSDRAAIYVIICVISKDDWEVIDVGQSGELGTRIDTHERKRCWEQHCPNGNIWVCIYPMPSSSFSKQQRIELEGKIRDEYNPVCGEK